LNVTEAAKGGFNMRVLLVIAAVVLALPVLVVVGIALGPAALGVLFLIGCTLLVSSIVRLAMRVGRHTRTPPALHG
jgi:hypothetical protein